MTPRTAQLPLAGWGGLRHEPCSVFRPERLSELRSAMGAGAAGSIIARGLGRGYGDCSVNSAGVVLMTRLDQLVEFDAATGVLEAEAGHSIADLIDLMLPRGWFMPVTPGTKFVTLGGAVAADVHGKNHHIDGTIGQFVDALTVMLASGELMRCSRDENTDLFLATIGGMGLTGTILRVRMRLRRVESAYVKATYRQAANLDAAMTLFESSEVQASPYSVAWINCLKSGQEQGQSVIIQGDHLPAAEVRQQNLSADPLKRPRNRRSSIPFNLPGLALNRDSVRAFNWLYYLRHKDHSRCISLEPFFYPLDRISHWNRMYGRRGFVQYQALVPTASARVALPLLLGRIAAAGAASFLAVLKRTGAAGDGILSFPFPGYTLALDLPFRGDRTVKLLSELDAVLLDHGGRLYLAKDAVMSGETFRRMYPRVDEFLAVKAKYDPDNRFSSSQSRRLGLTPT